MELTGLHKEIVDEQGHLLVEGGPGSGKTTIAIIKAAKLINKLVSGQRILFLSFSNPAVARAIEAIEQSQLFTKETKKLIEVETYHAFYWQILKSHGYLLGLPRKLNILTPVTEAIALSAIRNVPKKGLSDKDKERMAELANEELRRIAFEQGYIAFSLFAPLVEELLSKCKKLRGLICKPYPFIFLDEFQDTSDAAWEIVKLLGEKSILNALADPEQRIYDFAGAHPERLNHYRTYFNPKEFSFGQTNHRSIGTDIALFGNDILLGRFRQETYKGIEFDVYKANQNQAFTSLRIQTYNAMRRLIETRKNDWSLAILVPTKKLMRMVSDNFRLSPEISHNASIDMEGAIISAEIIAILMQPHYILNTRSLFIELICGFFQGKGGNKPTKTDLDESISTRKAYERILIAETKKLKVPSTKLDETLKTFDEISRYKFSGNPKDDWLRVRTSLQQSDCKRLNQIADEAKNIRLLERGTQLRDALAADWREYGCYMSALPIVRQSFVQDYFASSSKPETGIIIMNMHKAKGKQFDEVIIFENWPKVVQGKVVSNTDRIVRGNSINQDLSHARQNFRVSITRAKTRTTIMTPETDVCILLRQAS